MQATKLKQGALALLAATLFFAAPSAFAKVIWQDFSVSYLQGRNYHPQTLSNGIQTQAERRQVVTVEHASGHTWGGTFLFIDRLMSSEDEYPNDAMYGEFSINPNVAKPGGFVKNVFLSGQMEFGSGDNGANNRFNLTKGNSFNNMLLGVGLGLDIPGASFFNVVFYRRLNDDQILDASIPTDVGRTRPDNNQLTLTWRFDFANDSFRFDGFLDYATSFDFDHNDDSMGGTSEASLNFTPQLKYDLGRAAGYTPKKLWVGVEYVAWQNKFGSQHWDENNANILVKWHF
ncbi:MAG: DUF5020 domain-containing protein [Gammaproteobacteria bacterium]